MIALKTICIEHIGTPTLLKATKFMNLLYFKLEIEPVLSLLTFTFKYLHECEKTKSSQLQNQGPRRSSNQKKARPTISH
jgi:hypothetical protein